MKERLVNGVFLTAVSFLAWSASEITHEHYLPQTKIAAGIDVVYFPSGVRLLLLMIGGASAAVGIGLSNLLRVGSEFGLQNPALIAAVSFYTAFATLLSLWVTLRFLRIDRNLKALAPRDMPWICLGTAVGSSILHSAFYGFLEPKPFARMAADTVAMISGDFVGSLVVFGCLWLLVRLYRSMF